MLVSVSTGKDPGLIQIGSALPSAGVISRFLKRFKRKNVLRGPAKTCVGSLLRLCSLGSLSASRFDPSLSNLEPEFRTFNGQPQREACVAILKQPSNKRHQSQIKKIRSKEACKARSEAPPQTRGKNVRYARRAEDGSFSKSIQQPLSWIRMASKP